MEKMQPRIMLPNCYKDVTSLEGELLLVLKVSSCLTLMSKAGFNSEYGANLQQISKKLTSCEQTQTKSGCTAQSSKI